MLDLGSYENIKTVHILKDEELIFDFNRGGDTKLLPVGCIFKSFLAVLVGIAIYEGKIGSIEDCVIDYIPHEEIKNINWYKLQIKHALSKTSGIIWPGPRNHFPSNISEVMQLEFEDEPGKVFQYKPDPHIIVYLLEEIYRMDITRLLREKLLSHFRNKEFQWSREDIQGMKVPASLLDELGLLLLNKGQLYEKRLFDPKYYEQVICAYSAGGLPECTAYGLGVWLSDSKKEPYYFASGFGGQYLAFIPQKNMVISILSDMDKPHPENRNIIELSEELTDD